LSGGQCDHRGIVWRVLGCICLDPRGPVVEVGRCRTGIVIIDDRVTDLRVGLNETVKITKP
jgi:hypothetical protein